MRCGMTLYIQNYQDWDRYEAMERGETVPPLDPETDVRRFTEEIEMALKIEDQGFDSLWAVEHHISPYVLSTNPLQLLTFFAGATKRIDVGTMVVVVPWHEPLRVAEDITMLHNLLGPNRRAIIGFGRGAARREFRQFRLDMNESRDRMSEGVQIIRKALSEESFSFEGEHYKLDRVTMRPRPRDPQQLLADMSYSWGSPTSAAVGARLGLRPLIIPQKGWDQYHGELAEFAQARAEMGFGPVRPRIHMTAICTETEAEAEALAHKHLREYPDSATRIYELHGHHFKDIKGYEHYAATASIADSRTAMVDVLSKTYVDNHVWGTPDQCIRKLQNIAKGFHPEEFMLVFRFGTMSKEVAEKSAALFAREVLPAIHEIKLEEPITYDAVA